jgi:hypothetical protein
MASASVMHSTRIMLCKVYKEAKGAKSVRLDCAATDYRKAYQLTTQVEEKDQESTVSALLMKLSSLFSPVDGPPRPAVWFRDNCLPLRDGYADSHDKKVECRVNGCGALTQVENTRYFFSLYRWLVCLGDDDAGADGRGRPVLPVGRNQPSRDDKGRRDSRSGGILRPHHQDNA